MRINARAHTHTGAHARGHLVIKVAAYAFTCLHRRIHTRAFTQAHAHTGARTHAHAQTHLVVEVEVLRHHVDGLRSDAYDSGLSTVFECNSLSSIAILCHSLSLTVIKYYLVGFALM
jgi:hypothetical protein